MYILTEDNWIDRVLDYHRPAGYLKIAVSAWAIVSPIEGIYLIPPRNLTVLREYLREFGLRAVIRKVRSRLNESLRNEKFVSVGLGRVISPAGAGVDPEGDPVAFLAPAHPRCVERIVLPPQLVRSVAPEVVALHSSPDGIRFYESGPPLPSLEEIAGWQPESGRVIADGSLQAILTAVEDYWKRPVGNFRILNNPQPTVPATSFRESRPASPPGRYSAVLYGLGNYAKTQIIPGLDPRIRIFSIHELDPTQIPEEYRKRFWISTDPEGGEDEKYDACLIAGYHHTHAGLAIRALEAGAAAVVEKPVVTTREQLADLTAALRRTRGRLYSCFQMRYNPLFVRARCDLAARPGAPVHITADVYEIPLPSRHWYRWPNSGSHLVSNGCHWLDHFLFMNDYSPPVRLAANRSANGDTAATVELDNGACLFLHLTHLGSPRIGVQDHVVMRTGDRTVTVVNGSRYLAEAGGRIVGRKRINKMDVYRRMYREISRKIIAGEAGDSLKSVKAANTLMLDLEEERQRQL